jgi:predicted CoA-binding protein
MEPKELARTARVIAVVGASPDPTRPSYDMLKYLIDHGYCAIPVRPDCESILGQPCVTSLSEIEGEIDIVDVFRRSDAAAEITREAIGCGARGVWLQEGVKSEEAAALAREAGLPFVQDVCLMKVLKRLAREETSTAAQPEDEAPGKG